MMLQEGDVVLVKDILVPYGMNPKTRPVVMLGFLPNCLGIAISTQFSPPLYAHEILLYDGKMRSRTGLLRPCVANCQWRVRFDEKAVIAKLGHLLPDQLQQITDYFARE